MESLWSAAFSFATAGLLVLGSLVVLVLNALFWCLVLFAQRATHSFEPGVQSTPVRQTVGKFTHAELAELAELAFPEGGLLDELPCAICQDDIALEDPARQLSCGHAFHASCISTWWRCSLQRSRAKVSCPSCRSDVEVGLSAALEQQARALQRALQQVHHRTDEE
ncbi:unnamed protein product [Polarella glacialis]|uniref:RING-type domain-containing protein n=1 Tax=Polarella glacialis TaxID=89957 RepID=A0A813ID81_POLGL|nr:unnamed protein product [Polarella glacialis]